MAHRNRRRIAIRSDDADALMAVAMAAGWRRVDHHADLLVVDLRDRQIDAIDPATLTIALASPEDRDALIAAAAAGADYGVAIGSAEDLAPALAFAARRLDTERRAGEKTVLADFLAMAGSDGSVVAIHIELVRLDLVNAAHGRTAGTAVIAAACERIARLAAAMLDDRAAVARLRGPAIGVLVAAPADDAVLLAARIEEALARPIRVGDAAVPIGIAIGIAGRRPGDDLRKLLARAARARAADDGRDGDDLLAVEVRRAIAQDEVAILFQPQARLADNAIVGVEALARWHHPTRGAIGAEALFAAAAVAGVGVALSEHVQRTVLREAAAWRGSRAALRLALNVTAPELANPHFTERLLDRIDASGFTRDRLTVEVTETDLMADLGAAADSLARLRAAGPCVAIDDFGTGYSSLAYLRMLPVDYIKLDKKLVDDIATARGGVVARGAIDMARSLDITTIAEGVEDETQRAALAGAGCALYQGFLLSPPLDDRALARFVDGG